MSQGFINAITTGMGISTDGTFTANSDALIPSQKAVKIYADSVRTVITQHGFLPKSQCAISGAVGASGYANFLSETTPDQILISATATPLVMAFANGFDLYGEKNFIAVLSADTSPAAWQGAGILASTGTNYLYVELDAGGTVLTYGYTLVAPEYEYATAGTTADSSYYVIPKRQMYVYNAGFSAKLRLFLGECVVAASHITSVVTYALNGEYIGQETTLTANTKVSQNHYIGTNKVVAETEVINKTADLDLLPNDKFKLRTDDGIGHGSQMPLWNRLAVWLDIDATVSIMNTSSHAFSAIDLAKNKFIFTVYRSF